MDRYMVSDSPNGPWMEFSITNMPHAALTQARAKMSWSVVWVAKMRPIMGEDLMPSAELMRGEIMERLATQHGGQVVTQLEEDIQMETLYIDICDAATGHLLDVETEVMVPEIKKAYGRDQSVRATDFLPPKLKIEDLL